jgi:O-methyltransferase
LVDLRSAYLDLLKRSLCDLLGPRPLTAVPQSGGTVAFESLADSERERRETGADWPANATTMVGLRRLDHLQDCVETVVRDEVEGDLIETGVWRGGASILMRATLAALDVEDREIWLADSFEGLPRSSPEEYPQDADTDLHYEFDFLAVSEEEVRAAFERFGVPEERVRFLRGFFSDSLPPLKGHHRWSLLRLDGDMYESTIVALESLYPDLSPGGFIVIDDYGAIPQCRQAVADFRAANGIEEEIREIDWTGAYWRRRS